MIDENDIEKAVDFMRDNAEPLAKAKANRIYFEQFRKSKKAILVQEVTGTILERESYAYGHKDYMEILTAIRVAVEEEERLKWLMASAQAKMEIWRTQQANNRFLDSGTS